MAPRAYKNTDKRMCVKCGEMAEVRWRREWFCGNCLNPEPTTDYLKVERERANGQWGGTGADSWTKL